MGLKRIRTRLPVALCLLALAACQKPAQPEAAAATAWKLDEAGLTPPIRFTAADIDASRPVCIDLQAHANSKWLAANPIPADQTSWGAYNVLRARSLEVQKQLAERVAAQTGQTGIHKIIADIWATGMDAARLNEQGVAPLASRLARIDALADSAAVAAYLRELAAAGENPLFSFGPEPDFQDSAVNMAYAMQGGINLPDTSYYFDADKKPIREAYERHIARVLELSGISADAAVAQARAVMGLETRLARASRSQEELARDLSLYYNPVSLADADRLTPNFPWSAFFASQGVPEPARFSLAMPAFHQEVSRMLADVPVAQWKSYLRYQLVDRASPYLNDALVTERFDFYNRTLNGQPEQRPRWKQVLGVMDGAAGEAMGQLYVEAAFPAESRARMEQLVGNLTAALKVRIENLEWMSDATKAKALAKWSSFTPKIGYPSKWRDWSGLATSRDSYFGNVMAAQRFNYQWELAKIGKAVDKTEWEMTPQTVNAYYNPLQNEIGFPAAILQPPFFDPAADDALNYGAIGSVIGHELIHGYDDQGARFGPTGNMERWWTDEDEKKFHALGRQLVQQFDGYTVGEGLKVNGTLTLGENIADLGGISIAYDAMQKAAAGQPDPKRDGLTREQRFFYGWASAWRSQQRPERMAVDVASDVHTPDSVRVIGAPSNMPEFAAAFGCKEGDAMVRSGARRIAIW